MPAYSEWDDSFFIVIVATDPSLPDTELTCADETKGNITIVRLINIRQVFNLDFVINQYFQNIYFRIDFGSCYLFSIKLRYSFYR